MFRARAGVLFAVTLLAAFVAWPVPQASAYVEGKVCLKFPVYAGIGIQIEDTRCQRWVCFSVVRAGRTLVTPACEDLTLYPQSSTIYVRGSLEPQVPLKSFTVRVAVHDQSQPDVVFPDCVWSQTNLDAGVQLFLDSCIRQGGPDSTGPWIFDSSFESVPDSPDDPNTVYGLLKLYYGARPTACVWTVYPTQTCVAAP